MKKMERKHMSLLMLLFAIEGSFLQFASAINSFGNNLYATNMGATEHQIGLIQMVPNVLACILLLPLGILADRLKSAKIIPIIMLIINGIAFMGYGTVPQLGAARMQFFFAFLAFTVGCLVIYNAQWQSFFGKVTAIEQRNDILAMRNRFMFIVGIIIPIICGMMMGRYSDSEGKLGVLRFFFYASGILVFLQAFVIARIPEDRSSNNEVKEKFHLHDLADAVLSVFKERNLRLFFGPVVFFYAIWQLDWSMWYLGQVTYCGLSETAISVSNGVFNIGQLVAIGIVARIAWKKTPDYAFNFASMSLALCPLIIMFTSICPPITRPAVFTILLTVLNAPQCAVGLCVVQMLLNAAPEKNRALIISLFTLTTTLTNSFVPLLGVQIYSAFGGGVRGFYCFNTILFVLRVVAVLVLWWRYSVVSGKKVLFFSGR